MAYLGKGLAPLPPPPPHPPLPLFWVKKSQKEGKPTGEAQKNATANTLFLKIWTDPLDLLAKSKTDYHCKIKETTLLKLYKGHLTQAL